MLAPGTRVEGKWNQVRLNVVQLLGEGANGAVYLVHTQNGRAAMKVCATAEDAAMEWGLLERTGKFCRCFPTPIAIDDSKEPLGIYFYLMESISGRPLQEVIHRLGTEDLRRVLTQALEGLAALHRTGYAFCDVKPENLLVAVTPTLDVRFVDVGGVTAFGRSVRQFTPFYDRGFWGLGNRQADAAYDIAALALAWLLASGSKPPNTVFAQSVAERQNWLMKTVRKHSDSALRPWLLEAITGQIRDAKVALAELSALPVETKRPRSSRASRPQPTFVATVPATAAAGGHRPSPARVGAKRRRDWSEWVMWLSLGTAALMSVAAWGRLL